MNMRSPWRAPHLLALVLASMHAIAQAQEPASSARPAAPGASAPQTAASAERAAGSNAPGESGAAAEVTLPAIRAKATAIEQASPLGYLKKRADNGALGSKLVLDTPFSVTVITHDEMVERGARSVGQIFFSDPSVYTPTASGTTDWWGTQIRGLAVRNYYVDDVPILLYWGGDFATEAVESVTALKGLTGFMHGFGEPGGALSYRLKRPAPTPETSVSLDIRNPRLATFHVDTSHRLADGLGLRANFAHEQGKGYNAASIDRTVASLAVDKQIGASLKWFTTLLHEKHKTTAEPIQFYLSRYDSATSQGRLPKVTYQYDDINVDNAFYKTETMLATTGLEWRPDDRWTLKAQAGLSRKDNVSRKAFAYLLNEAGDYQGQMYDFADRPEGRFVQAILQGSADLVGLKHELVAGLGFQRAKELWSNNFSWSNDFDGNLFVRQNFLALDKPGVVLDTVAADNRQHYLFLSDALHVNERLQAIAGLRYTRYKAKDKDGDASVDSAYAVAKASPTLALIYKPEARTSVYASYVEALEPGIRVSAPYENAGELLGATVSKQVEIGVKHQSGSFDYSAALFHIQRANQIDALRDGLRYLTQDGRLIYQGAEISGAWQASHDLNLGLGAVFLDASIDKVSPDSAALQGNRPSNAPKWQALAHASYWVPALAGLRLHGAARYFGAAFVDDENLLSAPGRSVVNAGFSVDFESAGLGWTLIGNLNNVFNKKYWATGGYGMGLLGEARNFSLALRAQF